MDDFLELMKRAKEIVHREQSNSEVEVFVKLDEKDNYEVFFDWVNCMGQLIISKPDFAPYRWVRMEILDLTTERQLYLWQDSEGDSVEKNICRIEKGFSIAEKANIKCKCDERLKSEHLSLDEAEEVETILSECVKKKLFRKTHPLRIIGYFRMEIDETVYRRRKWYKCRKCGCIWEYQMPDEKGGAWIRKFTDGKYPKWTIEIYRRWR